MRNIILTPLILLALTSCQQFDLLGGGTKKKSDQYGEKNLEVEKTGENIGSQSDNDDTSAAVQTIEEDHYDNIEVRTKTKFYEVLGGDTLSSIAKKHRLSESEIMKANGLEDPYDLKPGQIIKIPSTERYKPNLDDEVESLDKPKKRSNKEIYIVPKKR